MNRKLEAELRCQRFASKQHQVLTYAQAAECGMSRDAISRRTRDGRWRRVYRSVITPFPVKVDWFGMQMGACLHAGDNAIAAGAAAARLRRLPTFSKAPVEILINGDIRAKGVIVHRH